MTESICLYKGWRHHRRFKLLRSRLGYEGVAMFLSLQDYVLENCEQMRFDSEVEKESICLDLTISEEQYDLLIRQLVVSGLAVTTELESSSGKRISFIELEKARKLLQKDLSEDADIYGTRASTSTVLSTNTYCPDSSSQPQKKNVLTFSEGKEEEQKESTQYSTSTAPAAGLAQAARGQGKSDLLEGFRITHEELMDDLMVAPCKNFEQWLKGEMRRAGWKERSGETLGYNKQNRLKLEDLKSQIGEAALLGSWRLFLYSDNYRYSESQSRYLISYFLNGKNQWVESFGDLSGTAPRRRREAPQPEERKVGTRRSPRPEKFEEPQAERPLPEQPLAEVGKKTEPPVREESIAERMIREQGEDDIETQFDANLKALGLEPWRRDKVD